VAGRGCVKNDVIVTIHQIVVSQQSGKLVEGGDFDGAGT
jgi:hypothetical protein